MDLFRTPLAGPALWRPDASQYASVHRRGVAFAGAGDWREHCNLQLAERSHLAPAARSRSATARAIHVYVPLKRSPELEQLFWLSASRTVPCAGRDAVGNFWRSRIEPGECRLARKRRIGAVRRLYRQFLLCSGGRSTAGPPL